MDDDVDIHFCIQCNTGFIGLDTYVKHRKKECTKTKTTTEEISPAVADLHGSSLSDGEVHTEPVCGEEFDNSSDAVINSCDDDKSHDESHDKSHDESDDESHDKLHAESHDFMADDSSENSARSTGVDDVFSHNIAEHLNDGTLNESRYTEKLAPLSSYWTDLNMKIEPDQGHAVEDFHHSVPETADHQPVKTVSYLEEEDCDVNSSDDNGLQDIENQKFSSRPCCQFCSQQRPKSVAKRGKSRSTAKTKCPPQKDTPQRCDLCELTFDTNTDLSTHLFTLKHQRNVATLEICTSTVKSTKLYISKKLESVAAAVRAGNLDLSTDVSYIQSQTSRDPELPKRYPCRLEGCRFESSKLTQLTLHYMKPQCHNDTQYRFHCNVCNFYTHFKSLYTRHVLTNRHKKLSVGYVEDQQWQSVDDSQSRDIDEHNSERDQVENCGTDHLIRFFCCVCHARFTNKVSLVRHGMHLHMIFTERQMITQHFEGNELNSIDSKHCDFVKQLSRDPNVNVTCPECSEIMKRGSIIEHLRIHANIRPFKCLFCTFSTCSGGQLYYHVAFKHLPKRTASKLLCSHCGGKFSSTVYLSEHVLKKHGEKVKPRFKCDACGREFMTRTVLNAHMKIHRSRPRVFKCTYSNCTKDYLKRADLKYHYMRHMNVRPFSCGICGYKATTRSGLNQHKKTHVPGNEVKMFRCDKCRYCSHKEADLLKHEQVHLQTRFFRCPQCKFRTRRFDNLRKHIRNSKGHSDCKLYKCYVCDAVFCYMSELRKHLLSAHKIKRSKSETKELAGFICDESQDGTVTPPERSESGTMEQAGFTFDESQDGTVTPPERSESETMEQAGFTFDESQEGTVTAPERSKSENMEQAGFTFDESQDGTVTPPERSESETMEQTGFICDGSQDGVVPEVEDESHDVPHDEPQAESHDESQDESHDSHDESHDFIAGDVYPDSSSDISARSTRVQEVFSHNIDEHLNDATLNKGRYSEKPAPFLNYRTDLEIKIEPDQEPDVENLHHSETIDYQTVKTMRYSEEEGFHLNNDSDETGQVLQDTEPACNPQETPEANIKKEFWCDICSEAFSCKLSHENSIAHKRKANIAYNLRAVAKLKREGEEASDCFRCKKQKFSSRSCCQFSSQQRPKSVAKRGKSRSTAKTKCPPKRCDLCERTFDTKTDLSTHLRTLKHQRNVATREICTSTLKPTKLSISNKFESIAAAVRTGNLGQLTDVSYVQYQASRDRELPKRYPCRLEGCRFESSKLTQLTLHYMKPQCHNTEYRFHCSVCNVSTYFKCKYMKHLLTNRHKKLSVGYVGDQQSQGVDDSQSRDIVEHISTRDQVSTGCSEPLDKFICCVCHARFTNKVSLVRHCIHLHMIFNERQMITQHFDGNELNSIDSKHCDFVKQLSRDPNVNVTCPECSEIMKRGSIIKHLRVHANICPFKCLFCTFSTCLGRQLYDHVACKHLPKQTASKLLCSHCGRKFSSTVYLSEHVLKKHGEKVKPRFKCDACGREFMTRTVLNAHMKIHRSRPRVFKCTYSNCTKDYLNRDDLKYHNMRHMNVRPFSCGICGYKATTRSGLNKHKKTHVPENEVKMFRCDKCRYCSHKEADLLKHEKFHLKTRFFICPQCSYKTRSMNNLQRHMRNSKDHRDCKLYKCNLCDAGFRFMLKLRKHLLSTHGITRTLAETLNKAGFVFDESQDVPVAAPEPFNKSQTAMSDRFIFDESQGVPVTATEDVTVTTGTGIVL